MRTPGFTTSQRRLGFKRRILSRLSFLAAAQTMSNTSMIPRTTALISFGQSTWREILFFPLTYLPMMCNPTIHRRTSSSMEYFPFIRTRTHQLLIYLFPMELRSSPTQLQGPSNMCVHFPSQASTTIPFYFSSLAPVSSASQLEEDYWTACMAVLARQYSLLSLEGCDRVGMAAKDVLMAAQICLRIFSTSGRSLASDTVQFTMLFIMK